MPSVAAVFLVLALGACASSENSVETGDPFEPLNRTVFAFNTVVDKVVLRPAAQTYDAIVPGFIRRPVRNFLFFLKTPVILVNDLLQGDRERIATTMGRFVINAVAGLGGLFDAATMMGVPRNDNGFARTLNAWGAEPGPYLVLPVLGPSTTTDAVGTAVDWVSDPVPHVVDDDAFTVTRVALNALERRAALLGVLDKLEKTSLDYYVAVRSSYLQRRRAIMDLQVPGAPAVDPAIIDVPDEDDPETKPKRGGKKPSG